MTVLKIIEEIEKSLIKICIFGKKEYNCPNISIDRLDYCLHGRCKECPDYQKQLKEKISDS